MLKLSIIETASPDEVWTKLINEVQEFNPDAGTITLQTLSKDIRDYSLKRLPNISYALTIIFFCFSFFLIFFSTKIFSLVKGLSPV